METVIIIQARTGSSRFPKKILESLYDSTVLELVLDKCLKSKYADKVVLAVPDLEESKLISDLVRNKSVNIFYGSENDVLSRYFECAKEHSAKHIVRVTSDCPLIDPSLIDEMLAKYDKFTEEVYFANTCPPPSTFADGHDVEIFPFSYLQQANEQETDAGRREHVTFQFWQDDKYNSYQHKSDIDYSDIRLTVDYKDDLDSLRILGDKLGRDRVKELSYEAICDYIIDNKLVEFLKPELRNKGW